MKSLDEIIKENKEANEIVTSEAIPYCIWNKKKNIIYIGVA